jgi:thiamine-monophosphate kinase
MTDRTEISALGEFALIRRLTDGLTSVNPSTRLAVGDDAAIIDPDPDKHLLVTTDLLLEGVHFDLVYVPLKHLGYKAAVVNFSDICAMNGTPRQITVSLGLSARFSVEDVEALYAGIRRACDNYGVDIIGGDTTSSRTGLTISITCIGDARPGRIVRRSGAQVNDLICVSGDLGAAYMGLRLLEREKALFLDERERNPNADFRPDFAGNEYILERQLKPEARCDVIEMLDKAGILPTAMIDISDGLSSELLHLTTASGVSCQIYEERIPIDYQAARMAERLDMNLVTAALNGGEDYELLFTVPLQFHDVLALLPSISIIGHITPSDSLPPLLIPRSTPEAPAAPVPLRAQGFQGF